MRETDRDRQREATRRRLYEESIAEIAREGLEAASVDRITKAAGTSRTAYYFHFPHKESVIEMLNQRLGNEVSAALGELPAEAGFDDALKAANAVIVRFFGEGRLLASAAATVWLSTRPVDRARALLIARVLRDHRVVPLDAEELVDRLLIMQWMTVLGWSVGQHESLAESLTVLIELMLHGVRRPSARAPGAPTPHQPPRAPAARRVFTTSRTVKQMGEALHA
ncbi:MAG: TetR/AcrR family transcriptional regulator [Archangiaceae bacterium]|nr:TetR/AcrR family transcriptional regulator [Archangiaceae bacterium]